MEKEIKAFTLLEIMVVIALIWILVIWATNINFNSISDKQRLDWFFYKIKTNIESIKNNVLIWREVLDDWNTIISSKWQIDFNNNGSWSMSTYYYNDSNSKVSYPRYNIIPKDFYEIVISNSWIWLTDTGSILINWRNLTLTWAWISGFDKVLEIVAKYKGIEKEFTINTISWVIEEK